LTSSRLEHRVYGDDPSIKERAMDVPIACTLTAAQHRSRTTELAALAERALLAREPIPGGERLTFARTPGTERDVDAAIAAERSCCSFLRFAVDRRDGRLVVDVTGPPEAHPVIAALFA
jgi:hypothetical protein